jgi:hypothetical protein
MEEELYDEFGNYIGPAMGSDDSDKDEESLTSAWMERQVASEDVEMQESDGKLMRGKECVRVREKELEIIGHVFGIASSLFV